MCDSRSAAVCFSLLGRRRFSTCFVIDFPRIRMLLLAYLCSLRVCFTCLWNERSTAGHMSAIRKREKSTAEAEVGSATRVSLSPKRSRLPSPKRQTMPGSNPTRASVSSSSASLNVKESRGTSIRLFHVSSDSSALLSITHCDASGKSSSATRNHLTSLLSETFLPEGYPQSVTEDYIHYQTWDTVQALCSSVTGTLSTRSILRGVGVGSAEANLVSGTISWALRDGMSMVSRICFASRVATDLDHDAKRWRYVADITNDIALTIEIFSSYLPYPWMFLTAICVASLFKAVTGVAGGGSKASLTHHFALRDNTADLSAKEGSQETAAGMIGVVLGMLTAWLVPDDEYWYTLIVVTFFTVSHLFSNYRAVTSLVLRYFNKQRFGIVVGAYLSRHQAEEKGNRGTPTPQKSCLSPKDVRGMEGVLSYHRSAATSLPANLMIGASLSDFLSKQQKRGHHASAIQSYSQQVVESINRCGYSLFYDSSSSSSSSRRMRSGSGDYWMFFTESHPEPSVALGALFHVMYDYHQRRQLAVGGEDGGYVEPQHLTSADDENFVRQAAAFQQFSKDAEAVGWLMNRAQLRLEGWGIQQQN